MKTLNFNLIQYVTFVLLIISLCFASCSKDHVNDGESQDIDIEKSIDDLRLFDGDADQIVDLVITAPKDLSEEQADAWAKTLTVDDISKLHAEQKEVNRISNQSEETTEFRQAPCGNWTNTTVTAIAEVDCSPCTYGYGPVKNSEVVVYILQKSYCPWARRFFYRWVFHYSYCYNWYGC